jgi:TolA-binding protein
MNEKGRKMSYRRGLLAIHSNSILSGFTVAIVAMLSLSASYAASKPVALESAQAQAKAQKAPIATTQQNHKKIEIQEQIEKIERDQARVYLRTEDLKSRIRKAQRDAEKTLEKQEAKKQTLINKLAEQEGAEGPA